MKNHPFLGSKKESKSWKKTKMFYACFPEEVLRQKMDHCIKEAHLIVLMRKEGLYLFKNFTSRHYLIHRERFLSLLPLKPLWLSWREPIKSILFGNGKMLCWEAVVEHALTKSDMWRADLITQRAWSLHPGDRSEEFYQLLPQIIDSVNSNEFPDEQRGHFDLRRLCDWKLFLN